MSFQQINKKLPVITFLVILTTLLKAQPIDVQMLKYESVYFSIKDALNNKQKAYILNLDYTAKDQKRYKNLPIEIYKLKKLQMLSLKRHKLTTIDSSLIQLQNLQVLKLNRNQFDKIPNLTFQFRELLLIDFSDNKIATLPDEILQLKKLKYLILKNNQLTTVPNVIKQMNYLEKLDLSGNQIPKMEIENMKQLLNKTEIIFDCEEEND